MNFRPRRRPAGGFVDMTPFVDTIFNLLIFFALSMNFLVNPGITVDLPDASAPQVARRTTTYGLSSPRRARSISTTRG